MGVDPVQPGAARGQSVSSEGGKAGETQTGTASTTSTAMRFQGGTSTGTNWSPNRCRNGAARCSSPRKKRGRSAAPPSSTFFAGAIAWSAWATPCWRTDASAQRRMRAMQACFSQSGTTASATGACLGRQAPPARPAAHCRARIVVPPPEPNRFGRVVDRRLQLLLSRHRSALVSTRPRCPRNACAVERPVGEAGRIRAACAVDGRRQLRTRQLTFRHPLRQAQTRPGGGRAAPARPPRPRRTGPAPCGPLPQAPQPPYCTPPATPKPRIGPSTREGRSDSAPACSRTAMHSWIAAKAAVGRFWPPTSSQGAVAKRGQRPRRQRRRQQLLADSASAGTDQNRRARARSRASCARLMNEAGVGEARDPARLRAERRKRTAAGARRRAPVPDRSARGRSRP